jgi:quercetin dioxygenase-like cupin family protein
MSLTIEHIDDLPLQTGVATSFTGTTLYQTVAAAENGPASVNWVTFEQGARTFWHVHRRGEQVLYVCASKQCQSCAEFLANKPI